MEIDEQEEKQIREEYSIWKNNTHLLYDLVMTHSLEWPSLTVEWMPDIEKHEAEGYSVQYLYLGTYTSDNAQNYIIKASVHLPIEKVESNKDMSDSTRNMFPCDGISGKITVLKAIPHTGDVNKIRYMPQNPSIIASKSMDKNIYVYDTRNLDDNIHPLCVLKGHTKEGYGLDWSSCAQGMLASGSDDMTVCVWDVNHFMTGEPLLSYSDRHCVIEDVSWHRKDENMLGVAGDDGYVCLYDIRQPSPAHLIKTHEKDCNVVSFNPFCPDLFATASLDNTVALWDLRNPFHSVHVLEGHTSGVYTARWSPHSRSILASAGLDRRVIVWDLDRIGQEQTAEEAEDGPAELLFIHGGHTSRVNDLSWNGNDEWMLASTADDNILQIWKMSDSIYDESKYDENQLDESLLD